MILEFDCGNTAAKWRLLSGKSIVFGGVHHYVDGFHSFFSDQKIIEQFSSVCYCRVVSVAAEELQQELQIAWSSISNSPIIFAKVQRECAGIVCGYEDCSQLGIDRWAALIGASRYCERGYVVIDAGTALTVDVVDLNRNHLGGYIVPGASLMLSSLVEKTAIPSERIPSVENILAGGFGVRTRDALANGVGSIYGSFISGVVESLGFGPDIFITGGDAQLMAGLIDIKARVFPDLVLDGLELMVALDSSGSGGDI